MYDYLHVLGHSCARTAYEWLDVGVDTIEGVVLYDTNKYATRQCVYVDYVINRHT